MNINQRFNSDKVRKQGQCLNLSAFFVMSITDAQNGLDFQIYITNIIFVLIITHDMACG